MKKIAVKITILSLIVVLIIAVKILSSNFDNIKQYSFRYMPLNNVSNSGCFKAKLDHLGTAANYAKYNFLIAGSSMSLNNISGRVIADRTKECVYNISSWGLKSKQISQFLKTVNMDSIKYLLVAFNNWDFGAPDYSIDFEATNSYMNGNKLSKSWSFINKFNIHTFCRDWNYRCQFSQSNNTYESLNFDNYGSVLFDTTNFIIDKNRWNAYKDTTGFNAFYNGLIEIDEICKKYKTRFFLVYLPSRPNLLTPKNIDENKHVAGTLHNKFRQSFFDIQNLNIPTNQFCDGIHFFKDGAESVTNSIVDSLAKNNKLF